MAQEIIILECTEAKALGKPVSRYMSKRNKKVRAPRTGSRKRNTIRFCGSTRFIAKPNNLMQPKTAKRRSAFRRANRAMPRRRIDISIEPIHYKNPDLLTKLLTDSGTILPPRLTG